MKQLRQGWSRPGLTGRGQEMQDQEDLDAGRLEAEHTTPATPMQSREEMLAAKVAEVMANHPGLTAAQA